MHHGHDDAGEERIAIARREIEAYPEVDEVRYVSKTEALEEAKVLLANQPSSPDNLPHCVFQDVGWWAENGQMAYDAFNEWLLG